MAPRNLTREQAFAEMAKGRRCRPSWWSGWVTGNTGDGNEFVDDSGSSFSRGNFDYPEYATGWRLLKDLPPRAELVRELAEVRAKLEAARGAAVMPQDRLKGRLASADADLATTKAALAKSEEDVLRMKNHLGPAARLADLMTTLRLKAEADAQQAREELAEAKTALAEALARPVPTELEALSRRMAKGRAKYPTGCTVLSLLDEAGEVAHAVNKKESDERVREELLDVAAVAMRLHAGEIDREWRADFGAIAAPTAKPEPAWVDCSAWQEAGQ